MICLFFQANPEDAPGGVPRRAGDVFQVWVVFTSTAGKFDEAVKLKVLAG